MTLGPRESPAEPSGLRGPGAIGQALREGGR